MKDSTRRATMRFLSIYKSAETNVPPTPEYIGRMEKLIEDMTKAGTLLATEGCLPSALGARVRLSGGTVTVTDGPFVETKEVVGGFALLEARSKEHAIEMARTFLAIAGDGECEIRQIYTQEEGASAGCVEGNMGLADQFARARQAPDHEGYEDREDETFFVPFAHFVPFISLDKYLYYKDTL
jgi:hypothetical protein